MLTLGLSRIKPLAIRPLFSISSDTRTPACCRQQVCMPTAEEEKKLLGYKGDQALLGEADQVCFMRVPGRVLSCYCLVLKRKVQPVGLACLGFSRR